MSITSVVPSEVAYLADDANVHETLFLRAATPADRGFLRTVFVSTRAQEFASSGLSAPQITALLVEQFDVQDTYYRRHYPGARFDVVMNGGEPVGRLYHHWGEVELRIIDIALMPVQRGAKIGTRIMHALITQTAARGLPTTLYVEAANPVKSLYQRLGFRKRGENGIYEQWHREAGPFYGAAATLAGL
ncbi:GNAT family N-acetyltransferase [Paraburkholderia sp. BCC1885]|uniref:GNAT family N-acetyltransferase n=1 Tax=Paraburkholderia sp. BCC1885 TaxID=2562669 RepID=UPI001181E193|nr:GNAT family N-acetyltransferase [Paraburkholderia sp. BCC1885]